MSYKHKYGERRQIEISDPEISQVGESTAIGGFAANVAQIDPGMIQITFNPTDLIRALGEVHPEVGLVRMNVSFVPRDIPMIKPLSVVRFGNNRGEYDTERQLLVVDRKVRPILAQTTKVMSMLAMNVDKPVPDEEMIETCWGPEWLTKDQIPYTRKTLQQHVKMIRRACGEELGDPEEGAIVRYKKIGYALMSELGQPWAELSTE